MAISMLKIRQPLGRLIFNMGMAIPGKTVFLIETAPRILKCMSSHGINLLICEYSGFSTRMVTFIELYNNYDVIRLLFSTVYQ